MRPASDGRLMIRTDKFPSARVKGDPSFRTLTDRLHAMGFKAGIYSDLGRNICSQAYADDSEQLPEGSVAERDVGLSGHAAQDSRSEERRGGKGCERTCRYRRAPKSEK